MLSRTQIRDRIKQLMDTKGLSPSEVEKLLGVSDTAIYEWIRGARLPNRRKGEAVIAALSKDEDDAWETDRGFLPDGVADYVPVVGRLATVRDFPKTGKAGGFLKKTPTKKPRKSPNVGGLRGLGNVG